jgi:hypothetical protein
MLTQHYLSAAFPAMSPEDLSALQQDIEDYGQRDPITIFEGQVLDGWHRYGCLVRLGMAVKAVEFPAGVDPKAFVKSRNLHRRHMNASQRAMAVVACNAWAPTGRPEKGEPGPHLSTNAEMAKEADVSTKTIKQAKVVASKAAPEVIEAVKAGEMSLKAAVETTKPTMATPAPSPASGPVTVLTPAPSPELDPAPAPKLSPAPAPAGDVDWKAKYDELLVELHEMAKSCESAIADNNKMGAIFDADDRLKAAMERIKQLEALVAVMEGRAAGLMSEKNEAIRAAKSWKRKAEGK